MSPNNSISVILLAAGMSRRMGAENKLLLPFGGSTILETTLQNLIDAKIGKITVVVGHEAEQVLNLTTFQKLSNLKHPPLSICTNSDYEKGMTSSIQAGINLLKTQNPKLKTNYMICLSDMPLITPNEYQFLVEKFLFYLKKDEKTIIQPIFQGQKGNPTLISAYYKNAILDLDYPEGCKPIVQIHKEHLYLVEMPTPSVLQDADTPEDYQKLI